ncbi:MAG: hypothetical protein A2919_00975 [Candidatus Spechtbacteria bacterium RIFCSPLOWO2_01_FULL_43_12]|uniref:Uncharacterized protein n=1 Tax=Candidatus Spechtbacteria bacterium RIFCSPLOWO2_01_FULL_43_12 TaxID=1802162 RepID=A0A1G2HFW9_9BACT|nr:MAG: hypothetical protein A2919_00975 [Candidatus Spechtbacteria bacterium RIFCSPLOWO2_01_FULL_43_12]
MRRIKHNPITRLVRRIWRSFTHGYNFLGAFITIFTFVSISIFVYDLVKNPELSWSEKIKRAASLSLLESVKEKTTETVRVVEANENSINCSDLNSGWLSGSGLIFDDRKIKLRPERTAGAAFLKDPISTFFNFELNFRSVMESGVNVNISFYNSQGELRYAVGDGDFKTVRYMFIDNAGYVRVMEVLKLDTPIDNSDSIGLKISTVEKVDSRLAVATLTYKDSLGKIRTSDLENLIIPKSQQLYLNVGLGINASLEPHNVDNVYMEVQNCSIKEIPPSELLNI